MNRQKLWELFLALAIGVISGLGARYGINVPPPQLPPIVVNPPDVGPPGANPPLPIRKPDPWNAIGRIQFGNSGCSATIVGPRRDDGRWNVLTAAHCVTAVRQHGTMRLRDGRTTGLVVVAINRQADCAWLLTESNADDLPFAYVAKASPEVGSKIWHGGYGVDTPGNREEGEILGKANADGQISMRLSVSSGDSGGGICLNESGEIVSCVCCTSSRGRPATVWGASPEAINALRPREAVWDDWRPIDVPIRAE